MTRHVHWTLMSQSTKEVTCFELVMKRDHFNWSSSAKGKIALAVRLMMQNRQCGKIDTDKFIGKSYTQRKMLWEAQCFKWGRATVLKMIRFPDRDPTGFCNSEPDLNRSGFRQNSTGSDTDIQSALNTAAKCLIRDFFGY